MTTLKYDICEHNRQLDAALCRYGITLQLYKVVKNVTQLAGAAAGIYAMSLGADPMTTFLLIALIITSPEALEYALTTE